MRHLIIAIAFVSSALLAGGCNPSMFGGLYGMYGQQGQQPYPQQYPQSQYPQPNSAYPQQPMAGGGYPPQVPPSMPAEAGMGGGGFVTNVAAQQVGPNGRAFMHQEDIEVAGGPRYNQVMSLPPAFRHMLVLSGLPYALVPIQINGRIGIPQNRGLPLRVPTSGGSSEPTIPAVCSTGTNCASTNYVPIMLEEAGPLRMQFDCYVVDPYGRFPARLVGRTPLYTVWNPTRDTQTVITDESCGGNN